MGRRLAVRGVVTDPCDKPHGGGDGKSPVGMPAPVTPGGKAGRVRHMGVRPTVRCVVMNPCDHPHGGGEGKSPVGMPAPVTPWGKPALGLKTRKHKKYSNKMIVKRASSK